ncbi:MAG: U32 family peptidase C-terminal domain-containing protein [Patescibacteria group bacterium]
MNKVELLAPAGSLEKCAYAFAYGADACYAGTADFSLRVKENTITLDDIKQGIDLAHKLDKKFYVTINIYAHNKHLVNLPEYVKKIKELKPDAIIASDLGVISTVKEYWPEAVIHLSTQANCTNWRAAKFWFEQGIERVILAREVSLSEIKTMHEKIPSVEIEAFVHGAMCLAYSGRCVLSAALAGRSANLGDCAQCCRWSYNLVEEKRPGEYLPIQQDDHGTYILSSKDMCMIEYLDNLLDAGVCSLKIEGRNKSIFYLAHIIRAYRKVLDGAWSARQGKEEILKVSTRQLHTGFFLDQEAEQDPDLRRGQAQYKFVGEIINVDEKNNHLATVRVHNELCVGDIIEIISSDDNFEFTIKEMKKDDTGEIMAEAHGGSGDIVKIDFQKPVQIKNLLRIKQ